MAAGLLTSLAPTLINAGGQLLGQALPYLFQGNQNQTGSGNSSQSSSQMTSTSGGSSSSMSQQGWNQQVGSIASLGQILSQSMGTPTGNSSIGAFGLSQGSATTANQMQNKQWDLANVINAMYNLQSNMLNAGSQVSSMAYNDYEQRVARKWQEYMRGSAYQATVDDMRKAGINPILAASRGATDTPGSGAAMTSAQKYNQAVAASVPSAHTAAAQAMYDYGNNTAQVLDNYMRIINTAKQYGYSGLAQQMEQAMYSTSTASAYSVQEYANQTQSQATKDIKDNLLKGPSPSKTQGYDSRTKPSELSDADRQKAGDYNANFRR